MLVRMTTTIGGYRNGEPWPTVGGTIDVPDHEAADLIRNGYAEAASDVPAEEATDDAPPSIDDDPAPAGDDAGPAADDSDPPAADEPKPKTRRK